MANAREIRRRIRTVKNIEQITAAMKMVASVQLRKAQQRVESARPYSERMQTLMSHLASNVGEINDPLLDQRDGPKIGIILFTADRGLCGSYNVNLLRKTTEILRDRKPEDVRLCLVGRKGAQYFRRRDIPIEWTSDMNSNDVSMADVRKIAESARNLFLSGQVDEVRLIFARFLSPMVQRPTDMKLLPIEPVSSDDEIHPDYIFEPEPPQLLSALLPRYLSGQVYQSMAEAVASEHGARMTSMSNATSNASDMIQRLTLALNRARQAAITKELSEIMGGVEALKG